MKPDYCITFFRFFSFSGLLLLSSLLISSPALANPHEYLLDNGLKLIVKQDHRSPVVVTQIWYKAGSIDELNGVTGVAHVLEHMMFKGTEKVPNGEFSKKIAAAGGRENAFTSYDYTAYYQQLHKRSLPMAMELESDRMRNLILTEEEFSKEIKVVMEERRLRTDDQARSLLYEKMMAMAYQAHPYKNPIIGWMNDLENMRVEDAQEWYDRWYAPNNATLVVVGDVDAEEVFKLAQKNYGTIQKHSLLPINARKPQTEPPQVGTKRITVKAPAELPYLIMGYHAQGIKNVATDWEPYALEILEGVLDGNASARLNKSLVRENQIANSASAGYGAMARGPSIFFLSAVPRAGKTVVELEQALRGEIEKIIKEGVTEEELARVKAQVVASHVYQLDSIYSQAMQLGRLESMGLSFRDVDTILEKLKAVTAEQIREVTKKYFNDDSLTVAVLDPQPLDKKLPATAPAGLRH
ncbi:MAG: pitrilysin family protein [Nitrosomonas sp.]|uniref:M16 family metallopeptidase n=1 Tax=Nitrosomonas sp. TaxID=42353 RepID=UPI0027323277|nr:pitrilysin family protein [Nitrosomonas sp.]MDP3282280.1 pitrilysin family protein [Nitrosomonas sp.]MDP3664463.1 pitrilysin family protein [Nitrosomonas sp.]MDZ4104746.1 pitrilysin family protein [Nitrosomonas sp.]